MRTPSSNPPVFARLCVERHQAIAIVLRERTAIRARAEPRHDLRRRRRARASGFDGWQVKIILRLGVSEMPGDLRRADDRQSRCTCGGVVVPALALPFDAIDQSCGLIRSSYGPSVRRTNDDGHVAADRPSPGSDRSCRVVRAERRVGRSGVRFTPFSYWKQRDALAVDRDVDVLERACRRRPR